MSTPTDLGLQPWLESIRHIAETLGPGRSFQSGLNSLLQFLGEKHGFLRAHLVLHDPETGLLRLRLADGMPRSSHSEYSPGVGVTGQVFTTGKPVIVEKMSAHSLFMSLLFERTQQEQEELAFISVPVLMPEPKSAAGLPREVIGTLNADTPFVSRKDLEERQAFLEVVAALIANEAAYLQNDILRHSIHNSQKVVPTEAMSLVAQSKLMRHVLEQVDRIASGRGPLLMVGEVGVGRETLARRVHFLGSRASMPFMVFPCAAVPAELQTVELQGFQKGAMPGAMQSQKGLLERAHGGILYLDRVEDLSPEAQKVILEVLQEQRVARLGGGQPMEADVRILASTLCDADAHGASRLEACHKAGAFLPELHLRLTLKSLQVPPLRQRREDIIPLAELALADYATRQGLEAKEIKRISYPALELLTRYYWPGNISELINCMERAAQNCVDQVIRAGDLPPSVQTAESSDTEPSFSLGDAVMRFEKEILVDALIKAEGNMLKATRALKASYRIVNYKVKKYGIDPHNAVFRKKNSG